jgi:predicted transcriptional regulator
MELRLKPETEAKLSRLAAEQGRDSESLIAEAVERFIDLDEWFVQELQKVWMPPTAGSPLLTKTSAG